MELTKLITVYRICVVDTECSVRHSTCKVETGAEAVVDTYMSSLLAHTSMPPRTSDGWWMLP